MNEPASSNGSDPLDAVIADYLQKVEAGTPPDREQVLAAHPDLADRLRAFFADLDRIEGQVAELRLDPDVVAQGDPASVSVQRYFGDYELVDVIARGGMGVVYKARQVSLNREVALKMILAGQLATAKDVRRFRAEAEAAAGLDHPNIVPIYEVGEHDGRQYFSMKLVDGPPLSRHPRGTTRAEVTLLAAVARAVDYAHRRGILHRDLKPSNVLIDPSGVPVVTDFGLARRLDATDRSLSESGHFVGTPRYMSPEQAAGARDLTVAADVYALGAVLFERLTGRPVFTGVTIPEVLRQVREDEPTRPSAVSPGLNRDLDTVCLKCLEKDPARRYSTAAALADDLDRWREGKPILARPAGRVERLAKWARRRPTAAGLVAATASAAVLAVVVAVVVSQWRETERARRAEEAARIGEEEARRAEEGEREKLAVIEYGRTVQAAHQAWRDGDAAAAVRILDGTRADLRGWEWHYVRRQCNTTPLYTLPGKTLARGRFWSPDGTRFAAISMKLEWGDFKGGVGIFEASTGKELVTVDRYWGASHVSFSPDGSRLLTSGAKVKWYSSRLAALLLRGWRDGGRLWDPATGKLIAVLNLNQWRYSWSRDGSRLLATYPARRWDARTGVEIPTRMPADLSAPAWGTEGFHGMQWSPDGTRLAVLSSLWLFGRTWDGVRIIDPDTGAGVAWLPGGRGRSWVVAWSPDGSQIVTSTNAGERDSSGNLTYSHQTYQLWDARTGQRLPFRFSADAPPGWPAVCDPVSFSDDGKRMLVVGSNQARVLVWAADGANEAAPVPEDVTSLNRSPKGDLGIAGYTDGSRRMIDLSTWKEVEAWKGSSPPPDGARWSPDGKWLAAISMIRRPDNGILVSDHTVRVWEARTGRESVLRGHTGNVTVLEWSPDGSKLVTGSADNTARVWDVGTGTAVVLEGHTQGVRSAVWQPDGKRLLTVGEYGIARVWDAETGATLAALPTSENKFDGSPWSPDGRRLILSAAAGQKVGDGPRPSFVVWHTDVWKVAHTLSIGQQNSPPSWSPDGKRLLLTSGQRLRLLDTATWEEVAVLGANQTGPEAGVVPRGVWSPDGKRVLTTDRIDVSVWDAETGAHVARLWVREGAIESASWHPDGKRVLTHSTETDGASPLNVWQFNPNFPRRNWGLEPVNVFRVWDAGSGNLLHTISDARNASWSHDGKQLFATGGQPAIAVFDAASGTMLARLTGLGPGQFSSPWAFLSPDGSRVVTGGGGNSAADVWDAATGARVAVLEGHAYVRVATWSRDSMRIVTTARETTQLWDAATGKLLAQGPVARGNNESPFRNELSPDGTRFLCLDRGTSDGTWPRRESGIEVWDVRPAELELRSPGHTGTLGPEPVVVSINPNVRGGRALRGGGLAWSGDGTRLVTAGADGTVRMCDPVTGRELTVVWRHAGVVTAVVFSPAGRVFVTTSTDGTARVWDGQTGRALGVLEGHRNPLTGAAFSPDGSRIATTSVDGTTLVWDTPPGDLLPQPPVAVLETGRAQHTLKEALSPSWSPDGTRLVVGGRGGPAQVWDTRTWQPVAALGSANSSPLDVSWSPRGDRILLRSSSVQEQSYNRLGNLHPSLWDVRTGTWVGLGLRGTAAAWSPDGGQLLVAGAGPLIRDRQYWGLETVGYRAALLDAGTGKVVASFTMKAGGTDTVSYGEGQPRHAAVSRDGTRILVGSDDHCEVWDGRAKERISMLWEEGIPQYTHAVWSPDGIRVATGHADGSIRVWDPSTGKIVVTMPGSATASVSAAAWNPDGSRALTIGSDGQGCVWDTRTGTLISLLPAKGIKEPGRDRYPGGQWVPLLGWHPAGTWVATGVLGIDQARIWDPSTGQIVEAVGTGKELYDRNDWPKSQWPGRWPDGTAIHLRPTVPTGAREGTVATSIDGKWELFVRRDDVERDKRVVEVREAATRKVVAVLKGHSGHVTVAWFSPDGSRVVTDGVQVWDARTGAELFALRRHTGGVAAASYSPDWSRVATGGWDGTVRVWHATTGAELLVLKGPAVPPTESAIRLVSWSPDGYRLLTTGLGRDVTILDATPLGR